MFSRILNRRPGVGAFVAVVMVVILYTLTHALPHNAQEQPTEESPACPWAVFKNPTYRYTVEYPSCWLLSHGNPSDDAHISLGPQTPFRPLVRILIVPSSELAIRQKVLLADASTRTDRLVTVSGVRATEALYTTTGGSREAAVFVTGPHFGVIFHATADDDLSVFDHVLSTFVLQR